MQLSTRLNEAELLSGSLKTAAGDMVSYLPIETSRFRLSFVTKESYSVGDQFSLEYNDKKAILTVTKVVPNYEDSDFILYKMIANDQTLHVEELFRQVPEYASSNNRPEIRAARFSTNNNVKVAVRTFGSIGTYMMQSVNISKSGILLKEFSHDLVPFSINTIIEMTIDPECEWLDASMPCVGKVMRREPGTTNFGVKLVEMDETSLAKWIRLVDCLEERMHSADESAA